MKLTALSIAASVAVASAAMPYSVKASTLTVLEFSNQNIANDYDYWRKFYQTGGIVDALPERVESAALFASFPQRLTANDSYFFEGTTSRKGELSFFIETEEGAYDAFDVGSNTFEFTLNTDDSAQISSWEIFAVSGSTRGFDGFTWIDDSYGYHYEYVLSSDTSDCCFDITGSGSAEGNWTVVSEATSIVPLPATAWLMVAGLGGLAALRRHG